MKIFLDLEFTGLHQYTSIISIGIVDENGNKFYAEFNDFEHAQVDEWLETNVINNLLFINNSIINVYSKKETYVKHNKDEIVIVLDKWLKEINTNNEKIEIWGDCIPYDWVLLCELFGGALNIPKYIYYIPFDLCTLFKIKGIKCK